ncbi:MAG: response regulator transcription factor [Chloroflexi bacterium]|nr:response regulator transcription factor [Chloroflexota bacterium]
MTTIRVVVADDHPVAREGLSNLLNKAVDIEVVGETDNGVEVLRLVEGLTPDVLLLDMEMPGLTGIEVAQQLQITKSPVRILALSAHDDKEYIQGLLVNGAAGYLTKEEVPQTIIEAVRGVARGEQGWVSRQVAVQMATWLQEETTQPALTKRELEVLKLVVKGKTNQEIGITLGISEKTVEKHLEGVFTKLQVSSRVEAAVHAVREGLA